MNILFYKLYELSTARSHSSNKNIIYWVTSVKVNVPVPLSFSLTGWIVTVMNLN